MRYIAVAFLMVASSAMAKTPQVDISEVIRRGDMVEHVNGIAQNENDPKNRLIEEMAVPEDDSGKWFVSVVSTPGCPHCEKLKSDWKTNEYLRSLAIPGDPHKSWAHLAFYTKGDQSQDWRWKNITFRGYPTIIVQPPRSGEYGPVSDIVYLHAGYPGPEKLTRGIIDAIKLRISTVTTKAMQIRGPPDNVVGVDPPWDIQPKPDRNTRPLLPRLVPDVPPKEAPAPFPGWAIPTLMAGGPLAWVGIAALAWFGFTQIREWRKRQGDKLLINDQMMAMLESLAKKFDIERDPPSPTEEKKK